MTGPVVQRVPALTIRAFLEQPLTPYRRISELNALCERIASQPLAETVADLRREIKRQPVPPEDYRRLNVLISQLHHLGDADVQALDEVRQELQAAYEVSRTSALLRTSGERG